MARPPSHVRGRRRASALLGATVAAVTACAHDPADRGPTRTGDEPGLVRAVPLSTCRAAGSLNDPCFPTPSEIGTRPVHPCFDRRRGRCGGAGRGLCYLIPLADGKRCSSGEGTCSQLRCVPE